MIYDRHLDDKYDPLFKRVDGLLWHPWVGKRYDETRILVLGISTDDRGDDPAWAEYASKNRDAFRYFDFDAEDCFAGRGHRAFRATTLMFLDGADKEYNQGNIKLLWEHIAFNNYYQVVVEGMGSTPEQSRVEGAKRVLMNTIKIIKPKLVLAWSTQLRGMNLRVDREHHKTIGSGKGGRPRVMEGNPPIVGIKHPGRWSRPNAGDPYLKNNGREWLDFLLADKSSKYPIRNLVDCLKRSG